MNDEMNLDAAEKMPRVLMVCGISRELHGDGGVGIHVKNMAHELKSLGHAVDVVWKEDFGLSAGFRQDLTPFVMQFLIASRLARRKFRAAYDVVHIHGADGCVWGVVRKIVSQRKPAFVWTTHGLESLTLPLYRRYAKEGSVPRVPLLHLLGYRVMGMRTWMSARMADCTVAITSANAAHLRRRSKVETSKLAVIPNGVDSDIFELPRRSSEKIQSALFIGTWWWRKGHWLLRDAFCCIAPEYPTLHLHLWGTLKPESDITDEFPEELRGRVHVVCSFSRESLVKELSGFDSFVLPSIYEGGTPLALLEAMAAGLPCVVSKSPGVEDLVKGSPPCAAVAIPGNVESLCQAWKQVLDNPEEAHAMGLLARERARSFTWKRVAERLSRVYIRLMSQRG